MTLSQLNDFRAIEVIRVFLASPGDLGPERHAAQEAVDEINRTVARPAGYQFDLIGWEDTLSSVGRPQEIINKELDTCQIFIGLIWQRWGTPPSKYGKFTSGFEEEYFRARDRYTKTGTPSIRLFFKNVDASKRADAGPELSKVLEFKFRLIAEKALLFQTFDDAQAFAQQVRFTLADYINKLSDTYKNKHHQENSHSTESNTDNDNTKENTIEEVEILREISTNIINTKDESNNYIDATKVARLRNLAISLGGTANDQTSLGAHDANLLYQSKNEINFSSHEISSLVEAGIDAFTQENTPIWSWISNKEKLNKEWIFSSTIMGPEQRRTNCFKVMETMGIDLSIISNKEFKRDMIAYWLDTDSHFLKIAALEYLGKYGTLNEVAAINKEIKNANSAIRKIAQLQIIKILIKYDIKSAIDILINDEIICDVNYILDETKIISKFSNENLKHALKSNIECIRMHALKNTEERDLLNEKILISMLSDTSIEIRNFALLRLERLGKTFTEDEAKSYLIRPLVGSQGEEGREQLDAFIERQEMARSSRDLELDSRTKIFTSDISYFALCKKEPSKQLSMLRENFDDRFSKFFVEYTSRMRKAYVDESTVNTIEKLINNATYYWKRNWMRKALDILIIKGGKSDLQRIRKALDDDALNPKESDINFLEKYGSFEDISRVCKIASDYRLNTGSAFLLNYGNNNSHAAKAIIKLSKKNVLNIFSLDISPGILSHIILEISSQDFLKVISLHFDQLIFHSSDVVRKATSLKILNSLNKKQFQEKFEYYQNVERDRFYNVIFWLDLGDAFPYTRARNIAKSEMSKIK